MGERRGGGLVLALALIGIASACGSSADGAVVVRDLDAIQVMSPADVVAMRSSIPEYSPSATTLPTDDPNDSPPPDSSDTADTIPLNEDNRPPELKLFDAFGKFRSCIEDAGETIRGNLQDPNNPAYQDPKYRELVEKCAARSKILEALREASTARAELTPEQIEQRNEAFKLLSECLKKRGWNIDSRVDEKGLITPTRFASPDGTLNERDLEQCLSETGINDAIENGAG